MAVRDDYLGIPDLGSMQRDYTFELVLPDMQGTMVSGAVVAQYCQAIKYGQYNITDVTEFRIGQLRKFFPNELNIENVTLTFITPAPDIVSLYLAKWKALMLDEFGRFNLPSSYKLTMYALLYTRNGEHVNTIKMSGAFPVTFPSITLGYGSEQVVTFDVNFKCDYVEAELRQT